MLIKKKTTIEDIEQYYLEVMKSPAVIEIANGFKSLKIGLIPRLAQFFITIAKNKSVPFQFSWVKLNDEDSQSNIINDIICVTAILMSDEVYGEHSHALKKLLNEQLVNRFKQSIFKSGRQIQMMAVDHSIEQFANPECFYLPSNGGFINRDSTHYAEVLKDFFKKTDRKAKFKDTEFDGLSELLFELIDNTEQHGKSDFTRGIFKKSVRSVVLNMHLLTKRRDLSRVCGENNPTAEYINSVKDDNKTLHLLEISIFDSGPGIYKSFLKNEASSSIKDEAKTLSESFLDEVTSKPAGYGVGRGLNKARLILNDRRGFISIRSGRLSVYRNYKLIPLTNLNNFESLDIKFFDEKTRQSSEFSEMKSVEGVSYTILVPLR